MENNVEMKGGSKQTQMSSIFSENNHIPRLSRLSTEKIAELVEHDRLPLFDYPLLSTYSNEIVKILSAKKKLALCLKLMTPDKFHITKIDLNAEDIYLNEIKYCFGHDIHYFRLGDVAHTTSTGKIPIDEIITAAMNEKAKHNLRHLNLCGKKKLTQCWPIFVSENFPNLEGLSFANRATSNDTLSQIGMNLKQLKYLDISNTYVTDISCISEMKNLEVLIMYNLNILKGDVAETLSNFSKLRVLDISRKVNSDYLLETSQDAHGDVASGIYNQSTKALELNGTTPWPELRALDMSGLSIVQFGTDRALEFVQKIIEAHPKLEQIALLATPLDTQTIEFPGRYLNVINSATRKSVLYSLRHYVTRESCRAAFTSHALHSVYYLLQSGYDKFSNEEISECLRLVCTSMQRYLHTLAVQIAGSACLYHLCKMKRIRKLSVKDVCNCIERSLDAAENYQSMTQLQKNVWLTICNDYLLHLDGIDFHRTCKVALDTMLSNRDASVERMTIAIVSIVTPKVRNREAPSLTSDSRYINHLVKIMHDYLATYKRESRIGHQNQDNDNTLYTLKFTLSALWNLTDECESTCRIFYEAGGIDIAFKVLEAFSLHFNVQTKVLGILNNVAEVDDIKSAILSDPTRICLLMGCLDGNFNQPDNKGRYRDVERSYFAGGILANLLCDDTVWEFSGIREEACEKLMETIQLWPNLSAVMVTYRSLTPFCRILERSTSNGAIMWCLWGIQHVLRHSETNSPPNSEIGYVQMVQNSIILPICERRSKMEPRVAALARKIIEIMNFLVDKANSVE